MTTSTYSSRGQKTARMIPRQDPIVYTAASDEAPIESELIEQYERDGFLILEGLFNQAELAALQTELGRLKEDEAIKRSAEAITEPTSGDIRSIFRIHQSNSLFAQLARDPRLVDIARYILANDVYIHQSRINYKPGFRGKEFYWHSDFETWHIEDGMPAMRALSISVSLTDNFIYNGSLMLIPGSHKFYVICEGQTPANHYKSSLKKQEYGVPDDGSLKELVNRGGIKTVTGKAGSIVIFDCNTMHGSNGNITPLARSNVFFVYNALSNQVKEPFGGQSPRPEYICSRRNIVPLK